tara:strand:+ start:9856 stop:10329 length:474 start_codon:yes stop_codon:yes gene_type:complete
MIEKIKISFADLSFHHIGLIAKDLEEGKNYLENNLGVTSWSEIIKDETQKVNIRFGKISDKGIFYELLSPSESSSPIMNSLKKNKNIINHVAYTLKNFDENIKILKKLGSIQLIKPVKAIAFNEAKIVFFMNKLGFVTEFIEDNDKLNSFDIWMGGI